MKKRLIAYHLPQFHEIKENNEWWGNGYTEWTAVKKWKPYFKGHTLRKPTDTLGYYNLLDEEVLEKQYELANDHGIEGFCFWTYWFGNGEQLLEKPLEHLLLPNSKVKYCFAWANHSWFDKSKWKLLKEQKYLGKEDYIKFYNILSPHFNNPNYIKKDNKLLLSIFMPQDIPDLEVFYNTLNELAKKDGFDGFYFISDQYTEEIKNNNIFDAYMHSPLLFKNRSLLQKIMERLIRYYSWTFIGPMKYSYERMMFNIYKDFKNDEKFIPTIFSGWDTTPRHGKRGVILNGFNKKTFEKHVNDAFTLENDFVFIKSWNEWAEGNILEPDDMYGDMLLEILNANNKN